MYKENSLNISPSVQVFSVFFGLIYSQSDLLRSFLGSTLRSSSENPAVFSGFSDCFFSSA